MDEDITNTNRSDPTETVPTGTVALAGWSLFVFAVILLCASAGMSWQRVNGFDTPLAPITGGATAALVGLIAGAVAAAAVVLTVSGATGQLAFGLTIGFASAATVAIVMVAKTLTKDVVSETVTLTDGAYVAIIAMVILIAAAALGRHRL